MNWYYKTENKYHEWAFKGENNFYEFYTSEQKIMPINKNFYQRVTSIVNSTK